MSRRGNQQRNRGMVRDRKSGVVHARHDKHPRQFVFEAIPNGTAVPFNIGSPDMRQILAIHVFDNLKYMAPEQVTELLRAAISDARGRSMQGDDTWDVETIVEKHAPPQAVYRLVRSKAHPDLPLGLGGAMWVAHTIPDSAFEGEPVVALSEVEGVPDIGDDLTDAQLDAAEARIAELRIARSQAANLDVPVETEAPEWRQWREQVLADKQADLERQAAAEAAAREASE